MSAKPRVLVVGCGAIGGVISTLVAQAETADVHVLSRNTTVAEAVRANGLNATGVGGTTAAQATVYTQPPDDTFDFVLLATQPPAVEAAAQSVAHCLAETSRVVVLQNGLCESRVAEICGPERTIGAIVAFGASTAEAGIFERTSEGGFVIGRLDGTEEPALDTLETVLKAVGPVRQTTNLLGARFSKLALNCAVSGLGTVAGVSLGTLLRDAGARNLALRVMREAVAISRAENIALERVGGTFDLNWLANPEAPLHGPAHWARHAMLLAVGFKYRRLRSSMLRAIEAGREPAVEFLNGEIAHRGEIHDVPTPINTGVAELVHRIARGELVPSQDNLRTFQ